MNRRGDPTVDETEDLVKRLEAISFATKPQNPFPQRPSVNPRAVEQWRGGIAVVEFTFTNAFFGDLTPLPNGKFKEPVPLLSIPKFQAASRNGTVTYLKPVHHLWIGSVAMEITPPSATRHGLLRAAATSLASTRFFNPNNNKTMKFRTLTDEEFFVEVKRELTTTEWGHLLMLNVQVVNVYCEADIEGPALNEAQMQMLQRKLPGSEFNGYNLRWNYRGSAPDSAFNQVVISRYENTTQITVRCDARQRREVCGMVAHAAWGVGGSII